MPVLDMRETVTPDDGATAADETEVKPTGEEAPEEGAESTEEVTPPEDASPSEGEPAAEQTELEKEQVALEALRAQHADILKDISEARGTRRELRSAPPAPLIVDAPKSESDSLADVDPAAVSMIERVIKAKGYVQKSELDSRDTTRSVKSEQDAWLEQHPEYKPENDPNDEKWNKLSSLVKMFSLPNNPKDVHKILNMAHRELNPTAALPVKNTAGVAAQNQKTKVAGAASGGGSAKSAKPSGEKIDLSGLKGFTDEEKAELLAA